MAPGWYLWLKDIVEVIASAATVVAIVIGGIWSYMLFISRRQKLPRANVSHSVSHRPVAGRILLNVDVTISNTGDVLLSLVSGETRVSQVLPTSDETEEAIASADSHLETKSRELQWPFIEACREEWKKGEVEVEPGENDQIHYDFIVSPEVKTVKVYSYFKNVKKRRREVGWGITTVYDLSA